MDVTISSKNESRFLGWLPRARDVWIGWKSGQKTFGRRGREKITKLSVPCLVAWIQMSSPPGCSHSAMPR